MLIILAKPLIRMNLNLLEFDLAERNFLSCVPIMRRKVYSVGTWRVLLSTPHLFSGSPWGS